MKTLKDLESYPYTRGQWKEAAQAHLNKLFGEAHTIFELRKAKAFKNKDEQFDYFVKTKQYEHTIEWIINFFNIEEEKVSPDTPLPKEEEEKP